MRFNSDGSVDTSFGTSGITTIDFGGYGAAANAMAVQADGKIVLVGCNTAYDSFSGFYTGWALARVNSDGTIDNSFNSDGQETFQFFGYASYDMAESVVIQSSGKIVVSGMVGYGAAGGIARFNSNGSLDTSFGSSGTLPYSTDMDLRLAVQKLADDRIVVTGEESDKVVVHRFTANGAVDSSFGTSGSVTTDVSANDDFGTAITVQADGKLVVAGYGWTIPDVGILVRYNVDGSLDTTFGSGGSLQMDFGSSTDLSAVAIQDDGQIVVAGTAGSAFGVARYDGGVERLYYQQDANYNVTALTDANGNVVERYIYTPYGVATVLTSSWSDSSESTGNLFTFQGGLYDAITGMTHLGLRDYRAPLGSWVQRDPLSYRGSGPNLYQSFNDNPTALVDPYGMQAGGGGEEDDEIEREELEEEEQREREREKFEDAMRRLREETAEEIARREQQEQSWKEALERFKKGLPPFEDKLPDVLKPPAEESENDKNDFCDAGGKRSGPPTPTNLRPRSTDSKPPLRRLHDDRTTMGRAGSYDYWSRVPTDRIIRSLRPGEDEPLIVDENGTIWQGNTRIKVLQDRGCNVNNLPRVPK